MPTANSTTVRHGKPFCDSFQAITPMRGASMMAMAVMMVDEVSKLCSTFSVDQNASRPSTSSFHYLPVMGPRASSCWRMAALPPAISSSSEHIMRVMMK